ncbi:MAG: glycosyltransferase family 2 protein [Johnsonella sp.]|nr:glycosyltransferase family 2 protein [Johnsonella sp.]
MSDTILIIPAFNEESNIAGVIEKLKNHHPDLDYIIIDDGSSDDTAKICKERGYHILSLSVNLGLAGAFQTGMRYAYEKGYLFAVQFDGDGQHRAEYVHSMRERSARGYDIVIASRFVEERKPFSMRMIGSRLISFAIFLTTGARLGDPTSGMRLYNRKAMEEFALNINYAPEPDTISYLLKQGMKISEVQARMDEREGGTSYLTPLRSINYMFRMLSSILLIQNFRKRNAKYRAR